MVYFRNFDSNPTIVPFDTRLLESEGRGLVSASSSLPNDTIYVRNSYSKPWYKAIVSIVICTYGRVESLNDTLQSLTQQTFKDFEVILITEKGDLSELRDRGLRSAIGSVVSFIDDDVYCPSTWLESVIKGFRKGVVGVTGPTEITEEYRSNRDSFKYHRTRKLIEKTFGVPSEPGHLSKCGAPSMASNDKGCDYEGPVHYLECCNMSVRRKDAINVGGFDTKFIRTSEWCEVDLALKLRSKGSLIFSQSVKLYHRPSVCGVYKHRLKTSHRWFNFIFFQRKWEGIYIKRSINTYLYRGFVWLYFKLKETLKF